MNLDGAFDELQAKVNANPDLVRLARQRRDVFRDALQTKKDIPEVVPSGSIARGSQIEPINDVDVVAIFDASAHESWGDTGTTAEEALEITREYVNELLGGSDANSTEEEPVRLARVTNHAVKCFLDDPEDPDAFTVDVTPALRTDSGLIIPERDSECWIGTDPERLIQLVAARNKEWDRFVPLVRVLKRWNIDKAGAMKSLTVEILALSHLPRGSRPDSLARFFSSAASVIDRPVADPTGHSDDVDPELDHENARKALEDAAETSWKATEAADRGASDEAACHWRSIFGDIFPEPPGGCSPRRRRAPALIPAVRPRPIRDAPQG